MRSDVTAIMTAMTDAERPWTREALGSILAQTVLPEKIVLLVERQNAWIENEIQACPQVPQAKRLIQVHRIPMARLGAVRNAGVQRSSTRWVAYLDGDDVWKPRRLERQLEAAERNPTARFIGGDFVFIDARSRPFAFANGSTPTPSSWLVERELMERHPFDGELTMGEDHFWFNATRHACLRIRVPEILVGYRIRGLSISSLHYGHSRQRRIREGMARAARFAPVRYALLAATYARYCLYRGMPYRI
jgi:glycosyltransferase involved in cell wall biosynthesis